ncbi:MAG: hypothetical protein JW839_21070 [Candidatus Lokiarchaeota archaeon]|nr:hypothetical protein [Candidatus Lokiarchaeota archaeon]
MDGEGTRKEKSAAFEQFKYEFFDRSPYLQWHDGVDASVVSKLVGVERDEAENMLIASAIKGAMHAAAGLAELKSTKGLPFLKQRLEAVSGVERVRIADAIETIEGKGEYVHVVIDVLLHAEAWFDKIEAAIVLRKHPRQDVIDALWEGVIDPDYLVRNHSSESLLAIHGLDPRIAGHKEIFSLICVDKEAGGKAPHEHHVQAAAALKELLRAAKPGR